MISNQQLIPTVNMGKRHRVAVLASAKFLVEVSPLSESGLHHREESPEGAQPTFRIMKNNTSIYIVLGH